MKLPYVLFHGFCNNVFSKFRKPSIKNPFWASTFRVASIYAKYDIRPTKEFPLESKYMLVMTIDPSKIKAIDFADVNAIKDIFGEWFAKLVDYKVNLSIDSVRQQIEKYGNAYSMYYSFCIAVNLILEKCVPPEYFRSKTGIKLALKNPQNIAKKLNISDEKSLNWILDILVDHVNNDYKSIDATLFQMRKNIVKKYGVNCILESEHPDKGIDYMLMSLEMISGIWPTLIPVKLIRQNKKFNNSLRNLDIYSPESPQKLIAILKENKIAINQAN